MQIKDGSVSNSNNENIFTNEVMADDIPSLSSGPSVELKIPIEIEDSSKDSLQERIDQEDTERLEGITLLGRRLKYNSDDTKTLDRKIINLRSRIEDIDTLVINACNLFANLNQKTIDNLKKESITKDSLDSMFDSYAQNWHDELTDIISEVERIMSGTQSADKDREGEAAPSDYKSSKPSNIKLNNSTNSSSNVTLQYTSLVGTIVFSEIIPLFEEIGGNTTLSASLNGNYGLLEIIKQDNKYYYKLVDKDTNKLYYVEINDKIKVNTEYNEVVETKEKTMLLTSTEIGTNNFSKIIEPDTLFFIQDKTENSGITFLKVLDSSDGNTYYIPQGSEVDILSLSDITSNSIGE